jgi:hypothetical protein
VVPGLLPAFLILSANANKVQSVPPGILLFIFFALDIFLSIFLENIRFSFFQRFTIVGNQLFSRNLFKFFSLVKNEEVFPLRESWKKYQDREQAIMRLWIISNVNKSGGLNKILSNFDSYSKYVKKHSISKMKSLIEEEYLKSNLTKGDKWAMLSLIEEEMKNFIWEEYFLFYQSSFNTFLSCLFAFILNYIRPLLNYDVWIENKTWLGLLEICLRPSAMIFLFILFVFCCVLLYNSRRTSVKNKEGKKKEKEYRMRIVILCVTVAFLVFFFPMIRISVHEKTFWLTSVITLILMLFSYRFADMWGLAVSRVSRKAILYNLISKKVREITL